MTTNNSDIELDVLNQSVCLTTIIITLYVIVFFTGIVGNSLVIHVIIRNKAMQSIINIFIANLALSDIMLCLLAVPFTPLSYFLETWIFGTVLCHIVPMALCILVYVSTFTCTAQAVVRFHAIVYPLKPRMKTGVCFQVIIVIWMTSMILALPLGIHQQIVETNNATACAEKWPTKHTREVFTVTSLVLQYLVPCSIITYCYSKISSTLQMRAHSRMLSTCISFEREQREVSRKRQINVMLIAVVALFVLCWLPLNLVLIVAEYYLPFQASPYYPVIFFTAHVIATSSAIYNPFVYAWKSENFKTGYKNIFPCLLRQ